MKFFLHTLPAIFYSVGLFGIFLFVGIVFYSDDPGISGILLLTLFTLLGLSAGIWLFRKVNRMGIHRIHSDPNVSFTGEKPWETLGKDAMKTEAQDLIKALENGKVYFPGGYLELYGSDRYHLDEYHIIKDLEFTEDFVLNMEFQNGKYLQIKDPVIGRYNKEFIRIEFAHVVRWSWDNGDKMIEVIDGKDGMKLNYSGLEDPPWRDDFDLARAAILIWR